MSSPWRNVALPQFPQLQQDIKTDVLIIGGGLAGILTAYFLHEKGIPYVLVEQGRICSGITGNTTAKVTAQHGLIYQKLWSQSRETAEKYLHANLQALRQFERFSKQHDFDFTHRSSFIYSLKAREKLEREVKVLQALGVEAALTECVPLPLHTVGAVCMASQAQMHPLKFVQAIVPGLKLYENTRVIATEGTTAITQRGKIHAKRVVVATHFPILNKRGLYFMKLYQNRAYVIALENAPQPEGMYMDEAEGGYSFRSHENLLLLGGNGARTGKNSCGWEPLRQFAREAYPNAIEMNHWAAQDCMSLDGLPYIGQYSKHSPNFYVATGFNKWGMTGAMVAAQCLSDQLSEQSNDYDEIFDPSRPLKLAPLLKNVMETAQGLVKFTRKRCPHLGCALVWNPAEHSWDCPCHGSRFDEAGRVLDNPANGDLQE